MGSLEGDPKTKRVRTSRPKVKTGCANCKQRRIKCDEKRPACTQCVRSKKDCIGYPPPPRSVRPFGEVPIAPKPLNTLIPAALTPAPAPARTLLPTPTPRPGSIYIAARAPPARPVQPVPLPLQTRPALPVPREQQATGQEQQKRHKSQQQLNSRRAQKLNYRRNPPPQAWTIPSTAATITFSAPAPAIFYQPSSALPLTLQEDHYFRLFRFHTTNELSGFFDNIFWSHTVLVACHSDDAIRHAVIALGALYKTLEKTTESPPTSPNNPARDASDTAYIHWEVALRHYSNACHALAVANAQDAATQRTRLMASVLLACFDSFVGDHKQAIVQIQTGLALLERLRAERRRSRGPGYVDEPVENELTQMFTRLAIQAKSYDMAFHFPRPYVIQLVPPAESDPPSASPSSTVPLEPAHIHPIPARFSSLREARLAWDYLCERIFRFMESMLQQAQGPPNLLPKYMTQYGLKFINDMEAWSSAFEPLLFSRTNPGVSSQEKSGIAVLKMFQIMSHILYVMTFSDSEMMFDAFQPQFKSIVSLAAEVVGDEERRAAAARCPDPAQCTHHPSNYYRLHSQHHLPSGGGDDHSDLLGLRANHIKASFSADLGIVPPLYVVATKSRDRLLRRQAIHLLRSSARREGMWDSELMARVGMWVVEIEEDGEEEEFLQMTINGNRRDNSESGTPRTRSPEWSGLPLNVPDVLGSGHPATEAFADQNLPFYMYQQRPVPAEKRVLVKSCEFDLREHTATLKCGTRGLVAGIEDPKRRGTYITW